MFFCILTDSSCTFIRDVVIGSSFTFYFGITRHWCKGMLLILTFLTVMADNRSYTSLSLKLFKNYLDTLPYEWIFWLNNQRIPPIYIWMVYWVLKMRIRKRVLFIFVNIYTFADVLKNIVGISFIGFLPLVSCSFPLIHLFNAIWVYYLMINRNFPFLTITCTTYLFRVLVLRLVFFGLWFHLYDIPR